MSNCEVFELPVIEAEPHQFREMLRCLIHTILFNRALGYVKPQDVDSELFDITYVKCNDSDLEVKVENGISDFCSLMERKPSEAAQLRLAFYEVRKKAAWFGSKDDRLYWEQWYINIAVMQPDIAEQQQCSGPEPVSALSQRQSQQQASLKQAQAEVLRCVNEKRDHIPPIASTSAVTFPFDITMAGVSKSMFSANVQAMKKMLLQTTPPPMLS